MSQPQPDSEAVRPDQAIALERAKGEVSDVLLNIEHALDRARRARKNVARDGVDNNAELALAEAAAGLEIPAALAAFAIRWKSYQGTERAEAQTYLNELFTCYGTDRNAVGAKLEDFSSSAGFMDLHWPQVCIVEMKRPSRAHTLSQAREQIMRYWRESADEVNDLPAAPYVVLCAFQIEELADRYESLMFLAAPTLAPSFADHYRDLTKEATASIALLYQLGSRAARRGARRSGSRRRNNKPRDLGGEARGLSVSAFLGQAVRLRRGFSPRDARSSASRSLSSSSSSGMDRRSSSMSQWVRTAFTFLYSGSGPSTSRASTPQRHSQTDGTSASTEKGSSLMCFSGHM